MADTVPAGYGAYLKADARYVSATIAGAATSWGATAVKSTIISPIALQADANTEAARQAQFLAGPVVRDQHVVKGLRRDLIGRLIVLVGNRLGYEGAGANAFVIAAAESDQARTTTLTVLKRL